MPRRIRRKDRGRRRTRAPGATGGPEMNTNPFLTLMFGLALVPLVCPQVAADDAPALPHAAAPATCTLKEVAGLDMLTDPSGAVGVPVKFNNKDAILGIDTGSIFSSISVPLVNE